MLDSPEAGPNEDETHGNIAIDHHHDEEDDSDLDPEWSLPKEFPEGARGRAKKISKGLHDVSPRVSTEASLPL